MEQLGKDLTADGSVMTKSELEEQRRKRGECLTCGRKCYHKKLFKMIPITDHGRVLNGRCLKCKPLEPASETVVLPAVARPATQAEQMRFNRSQSQLMSGAPGVSAMRRLSSSHTNNVPPSAMNSVRRHESTYGTISERTSVARMDARQNHEPPSSYQPRSSHDRSSMDHRPLVTHERHDRASMDHRPISSSMMERSRMDRRSTLANGEETARLVESGRRPIDTSRFIPDSRLSSNEEVQAPPQPTPHRRAPRRASLDFIGRNEQLGVSSRSLDSARNSAVSPNPNGQPHQDGEEQGGRDEMATAVTGAMAAHVMATSFTNRHRRQGGATDRPDSGDGQSGRRPSGGRGERFDPSFDNFDAFPSSSTSNQSFPQQSDNGQFFPSRERPSSSRSAHDDSRPSSRRTGYDYDDQRDSDDRYSPARRQPEDFPDLQNGQYSGDWPQQSASDAFDQSEPVESNRSLRQSEKTKEDEQNALERLQAAGADYNEILSVMKENPDSVLIQQEALKDLSNLHLSPHDYESIADSGGLETAVESMNRNMDNVEVQICGCRAVWNLSAIPRNQEEIARVGGIEAILTAMSEHAGNAEVQEKAMAALANLGANYANQSRILDAGGVRRIVEAMNIHSEDAHVQEKGCSAITNLASSNDARIKEAIAEHGGASAVVISMIMHSSDLDLQEKALRAVRNICANHDANKKLVSEVGGIDAIISAMQVHRDEAGIQEAGAWTLSNLAVNAENKVIIGESGGIDVIVRAMWVHTDNPGVQEWCCRALWTLSVDPHNKMVVTEVGGISAIVNAMQAHVDEPSVQEKGCGVLSNLAANDDNNKVRIVEEEALDAIVMAMVLHAENAAVQDRACTVLRKLAYGPNIKPMQAANVGELVREAASNFPDKCADKARDILAVL